MIDMTYVVEQYETYKRSLDDIAQELNTYPNKIRRLLIKAGKTLRSKSEAQSEALKSERHPHPMKGKHHSEESKQKIGEGTHNYWKSVSEIKREEFKKLAKERWHNMSDADKEILKTLSAKAIRKAAQEGSKLEKFLVDKLGEAGYNVLHHTAISGYSKLKVDILVPELNTAIEIDGPTHFLPIYGEHILAKHMAWDSQKDGILLSLNMNVIRLRILLSDVSQLNQRNVLQIVQNKLQEINDNQINKQIFKIEVTNE